MNKLYQIEIDNRRGWKTCSACGLRKLILEYKIIKGKSLFNSNCQSCIKIKRKNYKFKNKETTKIKSAEYRKKNREIINAKNKITRITEKYKEWV